DALAQLHPPQRQFGGASLTGTEPNAFVSYSCLRALSSIVENLRQRAKDHESLEKLLKEISEWHESRTSNLHLDYATATDFVTHLHKELDVIQDAAGLGQLVSEAKGVAIGIVTGANGEPTMPCAVDVAWIERYLRLVVDELNQIIEDLNKRG